jgi:hypothetical protein
MYCARCGAWNPDESDYCARCGRRIEPEEAPSSRRGIAPCAAMGLLVVAMTAVLLGAAGFLFRDRAYRAWVAFNGGLTSATATPTLIPTAEPSPSPRGLTATPTPIPLPSTLASPTPTYVSASTHAPTTQPTVTSTPAVRTFKAVYRQCVPHGFSLGSVKGQVFDKKGQVIVGAKVRIRINDYDWKSDANPATTNGSGWYEWTLEVGQKIKFVELTVDGKSVPFSPQGIEVKSTAGCFQRVDFVEE